MRLPAVLSAALAFVLAPGPAMGAGYPALDTTSHWTLQNWGYASGAGFYVQGAGKSVWSAPGAKSTKTVFYHLGALGVRLDGVDYLLPAPEYLGEMQAFDYVVKYGNFRLAEGVYVTMVYYFRDDGRFDGYAYVTGPGFVPGTPGELVLRMDYDLAGASNNIAEFLWSPSGEGGTISPPLAPHPAAADGRLDYAPPAAGPAYWSASSHEIAVAYPPLSPADGDGLEKAGFARIWNAGSKFGLVLWRHDSPVEALFKAYSPHPGGLQPQANVTTTLQWTGEAAGRPRYAFSGRDQVLYLSVGLPQNAVFRFGGKLFQRPDTRPLTVRVHQHHPSSMGGYVFDPDQVVRVTADGSRTFRNALAELAGEGNLNIISSGAGLPFLPFDGYPGAGEAVSAPQLHSLMTSVRGASSADSGNVREWQVDIFLVNWTQAEGGAWESLFDQGGADANRVSREGAAVFWPALAEGGPEFQQGQAVLSALHALGLAVNMDPSWSDCPFTGYCWDDASACGGVRCGSSCPPGSTGCRFSAHNCLMECQEGSIMSYTDVTRNTIRFNRTPAQGSPHSQVDWYRIAPEAWVKPGRHGIAPVSGPLPAFLTR